MKPSQNILSVPAPDYVTLLTPDKTTVFQPSSSEITHKDVHLELRKIQSSKTVYVTADTTPLCGLKLRWNKSLPKTTRFFGDAWERGYGDLAWEGFRGCRFMPWYFFAKTDSQTLGFGVKVRPSAMCYWQADPEGITMYLDLRCGGNGVILRGRTLKAAEIVLASFEGISSFEAGQKFCRLMCDDPIFPKVPVYGGNNWYYAYGNSSEEEILSDARYLLELTKGAKNPPFMVIDDCWQERHRPGSYNGGPWTKGNPKFPDMQKLAEDLKSLGVRPGIWLRPLLNEDEAIPQKWRLPHNNCLDPSHPGVQDYVHKDIERICQWGYQLIKHDFSTYDLFGKWGFEMNPLVTPNGWHFYNQEKTSAEIVKALYESIYDAARNYDSIILGCNTIGHLGAGLMHMNRTGDDTSGLNWERTRRMGINTLAFRLIQHRTFYDVDADCVGIAGSIPWNLNRQWADVIAESGTPLFVSAKPGLLAPAEQQELNQILLKASEQKHHKIPLDWEETDCPEIWSEGTDTILCHWYEKAGSTLEGNDSQKYSIYLPPA